MHAQAFPSRGALAHTFTWPEVRRGGERYLHDAAWYLATQAGAPEVLSSGARKGGYRHEDGYYVSRIPPLRSGLASRLSLTADEAFAPALAWHLLRHRYRWVHALTPTAAIAALISGHRTIYTVLGHPRPSVLAQRPATERAFKLAVRKSAVVTALSRASAERVHELTGRRPDVLPPGVRLDKFNYSRQPTSPPKQPLLLFPAFAGDRRKRLDLVLPALELILDQYPACRLVLAGGGDSSWAFKVGPSTTSLSNAVRDLGLVSHEALADLYRSSTVTVLPAEDEAFGLVLVESLACGTPVVCLNSGGAPEIVTSAVGRVAAKACPEMLAMAILEAIELAFTSGCRQRCRQRSAEFDWESRIGPSYLSLLDRVA
jgi:glycosyltransferase involved in cell wall biosynthesis